MALIKAGKEYLLKYGGHKSAAGFSVAYEKIDSFKEAMHDEATRVGVEGGEREESADAVIDHKLLKDWDVVDLLDSFAPHGEGNHRPRLIARRLPLVEWRLVGKTQDHVKFVFRVGEDILDGIGFGMAKEFQQKKDKAGGFSGCFILPGK